MTNPIELFQAGELTEAVVAATNAVRLKPMDVKSREVYYANCFAFAVSLNALTSNLMLHYRQTHKQW